MYFTRMTRAGALSLLVLASGCGPAPEVQNYVDRQAIETTLVRYSTGLDTFDPDVYASAFTEDAEFTMEDKVYRGREEIAGIIKGMKTSRAERLADKDPANDPPPIMHHVMSNAVIDIVGKDKALQSLAGQVRKATQGKANPAQVNEILKQKLAR